MSNIERVVRIACEDCGRTKVIRVFNDEEDEDLLVAENGEYVERHCPSCGGVTDHKVFEVVGMDEDHTKAAEDVKPVTA